MSSSLSGTSSKPGRMATAAYQKGNRRPAIGSMAPAIDQFVQEALGVPLTPAALNGLTKCHETFLHVLGSELQTETISTASLGHRVQPKHVEEALKKLGMEALWEAACHVVRSDDKRKPPNASGAKKKRKPWTKEQEEEQDRLLETAKAKVLRKEG